MYQIGDLIVYGNTGVCRVEGITTPDLPGVQKGQEYYIIKPLYRNDTIYAPVDGCKIFMRDVISREEADRLIDLIPTLDAEAFHTKSMQLLSEHYRSKVSSHDCCQLIELTMSIYSKKQAVQREHHKFGTVDERYMKQAEDMLYGEFAVALGIDRAEVQQYIADRVKAAENESGEAEANGSHNLKSNLFQK